MDVGIDTDFLVKVSLRDHPGHQAACEVRDRHLAGQDTFALAPQVLAEFIHVVTDPRRFEKPLAMPAALRHSRAWWHAAEVRPVFPSPAAVTRFLDDMARFRLGRKRILDTMLASTYLAAGVTRLITGNPDDYRLFPGLELILI